MNGNEMRIVYQEYQFYYLGYQDNISDNNCLLIVDDSRRKMAESEIPNDFTVILTRYYFAWTFNGCINLRALRRLAKRHDILREMYDHYTLSISIFRFKGRYSYDIAEILH